MNLNRFILSLYLLFILGLALAAGLYFHESQAEYARLRRIEVENRRRVDEAQARLKLQEKILERMRHDPVYVDQVIRQKLGYAKPEEYIYRFENN